MKTATKEMVGLDLNRIESEVTPGFPDVILCHLGEYALLELKVAYSNKLFLTPAQLPWHSIHEKAKGNHWILYKNDTVYGVFKLRDVKEDKLHSSISGTKICLEGSWLHYDNHLILVKEEVGTNEEIFKRIIEYVCKKRH